MMERVDDWGAAASEWGGTLAEGQAPAAAAMDIEQLVSRYEQEGPRVGAVERQAAADEPRALTAAERDAVASAASAPPVVLLGFVDEPEAPQHLQSYFFPSKVGGKPAWLDPLRLPSAAELHCPECGDPLAFLLQLYASLDERDDAFHRTLFVFICRRGPCLRVGSHGSIRVVRAQMPRYNDFYSSHPPQDVEARAAEGKVPMAGAKQCAVCGLLGSSQCGRCQQASYCSRLHQQLDWARHKPRCHAEAGAPAAEHAATTQAASHQAASSASARASHPRWTFPEFEVVIDVEPDVEAALASADLSHEERLLQKYKEDLAVEKTEPQPQPGSGSALAAGGAGGSDDDDEFGDGEDIEAAQDEAFHDFQRRTSVEPEQVVRYCRQPGSAPLWISSECQPESVPPCGACGAPRAFEFQVMPQLLNHLDIDSLEQSSIDWGTIAVYTCRASCGARSDGGGGALGGYLEEYAWRQMPSAQGAQLA